MRKQLGKRVSLSDKVSAPVALGDCFVCPAWLAQKNKGYNLATSPFSDLMRSQFDVNVSAFPRQWPLMTLKCSFSICPSRSLCVFQLGWSTRRSTTCCLVHKHTRTRVHAHTITLQLVLNQKCISPNVQCSSSSYHSSGSLNLPASLPLAQDLGRSISDESIHRILSDNLILENMTHQSARRDRHHQRVDGGASHAYLWRYWRVYSGRPRTLLLPICLSVCLSGGARSSVFLQNSSLWKD